MSREDTKYEDLRSTRKDYNKIAGLTHHQVKELYVLKKLSGTALKVYIVLLAYAGWRSRLCWPPYTVIRRETGITSGVDIGKAITELEDHKLVEYETIKRINKDGEEYGKPRNFYLIPWKE